MRSATRSVRTKGAYETVEKYTEVPVYLYMDRPVEVEIEVPVEKIVERIVEVEIEVEVEKEVFIEVFFDLLKRNRCRGDRPSNMLKGL